MSSADFAIEIHKLETTTRLKWYICSWRI